MSATDDKRWKVGDLAGATGLTVRALHHYDELGLLVPCERTGSGHRLYAEEDVRRLYRILALRRLGFPLDEIASLLGRGPVPHRDGPPSPRSGGTRSRPPAPAPPAPRSHPRRPRSVLGAIDKRIHRRLGGDGHDRDEPRVTGGAESHEVDARPSDALNLAARVSAPIFVDAQVIDDWGVPSRAEVASRLTACGGPHQEALGKPTAPNEWRSLLPSIGAAPPKWK